jgi:hypothetical protein
MSHQLTNTGAPKMGQTIQQLQEEVKTLQEQLQKEREDHHAHIEIKDSNHEYELAIWKFTQDQDQLLLDSRAEQVKQLEEEVEELEEQLKDKDKKVVALQEKEKSLSLIIRFQDKFNS